MTSYREARERFGLTQSDLAALAGVTQPAIAAYEAGRRLPTGRADLIMNGMVITLDRPVDTVRAEDGRGHPTELPAGRWVNVVPSDARVRLPTKLDWSRPDKPLLDLADTRLRASVYAQILDEGTEADIRFWIDPDALIELWPEVPVARRLRPHVEQLVQRLVGGSDEVAPQWVA